MYLCLYFYLYFALYYGPLCWQGEHFSHFPFLRSLTRLSNRDPPLSAVYDDDDGDDGDDGDGDGDGYDDDDGDDGDGGGDGDDDPPLNVVYDDDNNDSLTRLSNPVYDDRGVTTEMMMVIGCWHLWHFREARDKSALSSWPPTWFKPIKKNKIIWWYLHPSSCQECPYTETGSCWRTIKSGKVISGPSLNSPWTPTCSCNKGRSFVFSGTLATNMLVPDQILVLDGNLTLSSLVWLCSSKDGWLMQNVSCKGSCPVSRCLKVIRQQMVVPL